MCCCRAGTGRTEWGFHPTPLPRPAAGAVAGWTVTPLSSYSNLLEYASQLAGAVALSTLPSVLYPAIHALALAQIM